MGYSFLHRKERIVLTTIDVINEYGIKGISTREVAKRQGITEAAVFKHFPKKVDLLHAVLDFYAQYDSDISASSLQQKDYLQAIFYYVVTYAEYYENYPQITAITQSYDVLACEDDFREKIKKIYFGRLTALRDLAAKAQQAGLLSCELSAAQIAEIILGFFHAACLTWRFQKYAYSLKNYVASTLQVLLNSFITDRREERVRKWQEF
ncbi:MAG TPA: TetR/AcrR family transcriptional regulator [Firmicutes bacterium]|nr:TetR/AcrR family transcriptional regulator [Bacillota bacterium]